MTETARVLTNEEADQVIDAVIGQPPENVIEAFTDIGPRPGDIAIILRKEGGINILSYLPGQEDLPAFSLRSLYAMALYNICHERDLLRTALQVTHGKMEPPMRRVN